jgi:glycosyltransferase involved in cell wall biosynthesis
VSRSNKIVFVLHEATRTGASLVLYRYASQLYKTGNFILYFILIKGGELEAAFSELGQVVHRRSYIGIPVQTISQRIYSRFTGINPTNSVKERLRNIFPNLIIFNTLAAAKQIPEITSFIKAPAAWYIHELELASTSYEASISSAVPLIKYWFANSRATATFASKLTGIENCRFKIFYPPVEFSPLSSHTSYPEPWEGKFIVGSSGLAISRKGVDSFLKLAYLIHKKYNRKNIYFVWVGNTEVYIQDIKYDIKRFCIEDIIEFTGEIAEPVMFYNRFDVFVSTSKEESYGLACAEAAALGKPVIGFKQTGGLEEVISGCGGKLIEYGDLDKMAETLIYLSDHPDVLEEMSIGSRRYSSDKKCDKLYVRFREFIDSLNT